MPEWGESEVALDPELTSPADQPMAPPGGSAAAAHEPHDFRIATLPHKRRAAATFIFVTITLDMLAMGMIAPVLPQLITSFMGGNTASGAEMFGIFGTVWAVMQFGFSPLLGSLSDRFGRRPIVLLSNFGLGVGLPGDGDGADTGVAVCGARGLRHHVGERADGDGVYRRRYRSEEACRGLWHGERGLRAGLCAGAGAGRRAGQREPAASFLGGGRNEPAECDVWSLRAAGVAGARASRRLLMEAGESDRLADPTAAAS